jgi:hypothetical protein
VMSGSRIFTIVGLACSIACVAILHIVRPELQPVAHRLSEYANGPFGWVMTVCFVALGCGLVGLGVTLWRERDSLRRRAVWIIPVSAVLAGAGMIISGAFKTGVSEGSEIIHSRASALATIAIVVLALTYSILAARRPVAIHPIGFGLAVAAAALTAVSPLLHETRWTGLNQRVLWVTLLAWLLWAALQRPKPVRHVRPQWLGDRRES